MFTPSASRCLDQAALNPAAALRLRGGDEIKPAFVELVIPAKAGNQHAGDTLELDSRLRENDGLISSPSRSRRIWNASAFRQFPPLLFHRFEIADDDFDDVTLPQNLIDFFTQ